MDNWDHNKQCICALASRQVSVLALCIYGSHNYSITQFVSSAVSVLHLCCTSIATTMLMYL